MDENTAKKNMFFRRTFFLVDKDHGVDYDFLARMT